MSNLDGNTKSKSRNAIPIEVIKKYKSEHKKPVDLYKINNDITIKTNPETANKDDDKSKPQTPTELEREEKTDIADSVDVKETEDLEYYPLKRKRDVLPRKVEMKPKHELTVIAQTNKRKRSIPQKDSSSLSQNVSRSEPDLHVMRSLKKSLERKVPMETMYELIEQTEQNGGLDDEDLQEILTCESPVWWEDAPDGYTEDPLFTRPRSATDMYPSVRTQLKRDFRELKRANSPIVLLKQKWNKENLLKTIIMPRKRPHKEVDAANEVIDKSSEGTTKNESSNDIDLRHTLNNCDDTFKAKRSKLESTVKKISITSNMVFSVSRDRNGDVSICNQVSVIKNLNSKRCKKEIFGADREKTDKGLDTLQDGDYLSDLENVGIDVQDNDEGTMLKEVVLPIDGMLRQSERSSEIIKDNVHDNIEYRQTINYGTDSQSNAFLQDFETANNCENESVCDENYTNVNYDVGSVASDFDDSGYFQDVQSVETFGVTAIKKCLNEIGMTTNLEITQSDNYFEATHSDDIEEMSSGDLVENRPENVGEEQSENYFEDNNMLSDNYEKTQVTTDFEHQESAGYYEGLHSEHIEEENLGELQSGKYYQRNVSGNGYEESEVDTNLDQMESSINFEGVQSGHYYEEEQVDINAEQSATEMHTSVQPEHSLGEVDKNPKEQSSNEFLEANNYLDIQPNIHYGEIYIDNNGGIHVSNYEEVQTVDNFEEGLTAVSNQEMDTIYLYEGNTVSNLEDTQDASNFDMQSSSNFKDIQNISNSVNIIASNVREMCVDRNFQESQMKNIYEDISTDSSNDTQIGGNLCKPDSNLKETEPASNVENIQEVINVKGITSNLNEEPFTKYKSILEIFDSNFSNKQGTENPKEVQITNDLKDSPPDTIVIQEPSTFTAISTASNTIVPTSNNPEDAHSVSNQVTSGNIILKDLDGTFLELPRTSNFTLVPITNSGSNIDKNEHPGTFLLGIPTETVEKVNSMDNFGNTTKSTNVSKQKHTKYDENLITFERIKTATDLTIKKVVNNAKSVACNVYTQTRRTPNTTGTTVKNYETSVKSPVPVNLNEDSTIVMDSDEGVFEILNKVEAKLFEGVMESKNRPGNKSSILKVESTDGNSIVVTRMQSVIRNLPPLKNSVRKHNPGGMPKNPPPLKRNPANQASCESILSRDNSDSISDTNVCFLSDDDEDNCFSKNKIYDNKTESNKALQSNSKKHSFANCDDMLINDSKFCISKVCQCGRNSYSKGNDVEIEKLTITKVNRPKKCVPRKRIKSSVKSNQDRRKNIPKNKCTKSTTPHDKKELGDHDPAPPQINLTKISNETFCSEPTKNNSGEEYVTVFQIVSNDSIPEPQDNLAVDLLKHLSNTGIKSDLTATTKNIPDEITKPQKRVTIRFENDIWEGLNSMRKLIPTDATIIPQKQLTIDLKKQPSKEMNCKDSEVFNKVIPDVTITVSQNIDKKNVQKDKLRTEVNITDIEAINKTIPDESKLDDTHKQSEENTPTDSNIMFNLETHDCEPKSSSVKKASKNKKINHYFKNCKNQAQRKRRKGIKNANSAHKSNALIKNDNKTEEVSIEKPVIHTKAISEAAKTNPEPQIKERNCNELNNNKTDTTKVEFKGDSKANAVFKKDKSTKSFDLANSKPFRYCMICKSIFHTPKCNYCFGKNGKVLHKPTLKQNSTDFFMEMGQRFICKVCSYKASSKDSLERHIKGCRSKR